MMRIIPSTCAEFIKWSLRVAYFGFAISLLRIFSIFIIENSMPRFGGAQTQDIIPPMISIIYCLASIVLIRLKNTNRVMFEAFAKNIKLLLISFYAIQSIASVFINDMPASFVQILGFGLVLFVFWKPIDEGSRLCGAHSVQETNHLRG